MDNSNIDYNYFKTLPKDILIKMMIDINTQYLKDIKKERREWFINIMKKQNMNCCGNTNCYNVISNNDLTCDRCEIYLCHWCEIFKLCSSCGIGFCSTCNEKIDHIQYCEKCDMYFCKDCSCDHLKM